MFLHVNGQIGISVDTALNQPLPYITSILSRIRHQLQDNSIV